MRNVRHHTAFGLSHRNIGDGLCTLFYEQCVHPASRNDLSGIEDVCIAVQWLKFLLSVHEVFASCLRWETSYSH